MGKLIPVHCGEGSADQLPEATTVWVIYKPDVVELGTGMWVLNPLPGDKLPKAYPVGQAYREVLRRVDG